MKKVLSILIVLATLCAGYLYWTRQTVSLGGLVVPIAPAGSTIGNGLVAWWTFDGQDMIQNVKDRSGYGNNGFINGQTSTTTTLGKIGEALTFDAVNDYVMVPNASSLNFDRTAPWSVAFWTNTRAYMSGNGSWVEKSNPSGNGEGWDIFFENNERVRVFLIDASGNAVQATGDVGSFKDYGKWHHVTVTYDGSSAGAGMLVYVDGLYSFAGTGSVSNTTLNTAPLNMGAGAGGSSKFFDGKMDDMRIYNRTLSPTEISQLYRQGQGVTLGHIAEPIGVGLDAGLAGYWNLNETSGTRADSSGKGETLTDHSVLYGPGIRNNAARFTDNYLSHADDANLSLPAASDFTMSLWFKTVDGLGGLMTKDDLGSNREFAFYTSGGAVQFQLFDSVSGSSVATANSSVYNDGKWHNAIYTYTTSDLMGHLYIDNGPVKNSDSPLTNGPKDGTASFDIGWDTFTYNGDIDEVRYYKRALTATERYQLYTRDSARLQVTQTYPGSTLSQGLVGYWSMNGQDMINNVTDRSGLGNNGNLAGQTSTTTVIGKIEQGISFDGTDDSVKVPNNSSLNFSATMSVCTWFRVTGAINGFDAWVEKYSNGSANDGYGIFYNSGDQSLRFFVNTYNVDVAYIPLPLDGLWHHVCGTAGGGVVNIYLDGVAGTSDTYPGTITTNSSILEIGGHTVESAWTPAIFDETRVYNRALSPGEITQLYKNGI